MSPETFLEQFDAIADAPNGVQKLRELILQLAARGKLVAQRNGDEPASARLARVQSENQFSASERIMEHAGAYPPIAQKDIPHGIPEHWCWARLVDVVRFDQISRVDPESIEPNAWILELEDIEKDSSRILQRLNFTDRNSKSTKAQFKLGDVLYGKLRPYLNKVVLADGDGYCSTEIIPLRSYGAVHPPYLLHMLMRPDFLKYVSAKSYGIKMPRLGTRDLEMAVVPIPPLVEQRRIVAKIDELMALCDDLEAKLTDARTRAERFASAVVHHLTAA
jgi:type I restriction enzyme S subunit